MILILIFQFALYSAEVVVPFPDKGVKSDLHGPSMVHKLNQAKVQAYLKAERTYYGKKPLSDAMRLQHSSTMQINHVAGARYYADRVQTIDNQIYKQTLDLNRLVNDYKTTMTSANKANLQDLKSRIIGTLSGLSSLNSLREQFIKQGERAYKLGMRPERTVAPNVLRAKFLRYVSVIDKVLAGQKFKNVIKDAKIKDPFKGLRYLTTADIRNIKDGKLPNLNALLKRGRSKFESSEYYRLKTNGQDDSIAIPLANSVARLCLRGVHLQ